MCGRGWVIPQTEQFHLLAPPSVTGARQTRPGIAKQLPTVRTTVSTVAGATHKPVTGRAEPFIVEISEGHFEHRCGQDVDVVDRTGIFTLELEELLASIVAMFGGDFIVHDMGSYHIRFVRRP